MVETVADILFNFCVGLAAVFIGGVLVLLILLMATAYENWIYEWEIVPNKKVSWILAVIATIISTVGIYVVGYNISH